MPQQVCNSAQLMCSMGVAPSALVVLPLNRVMASNQPAANVMDHVPMLNIMPFGTCTSPANPMVPSAARRPERLHAPGQVQVQVPEPAQGQAPAEVLALAVQAAGGSALGSVAQALSASGSA